MNYTHEDVGSVAFLEQLLAYTYSAYSSRK